MTRVRNDRETLSPLRRVRDKSAIAEMVAAFLPRCWLCGRTGVQVAHIVGGAGRSHERCNLLLLCPRCHDRDHLVTGERHLHFGHKCWIKLQVDPEHYDLDRLAVLRGRPIFEAIEEPYGWGCGN